MASTHTNSDTTKVGGLRILSLDGGDLHCISQLTILEEFMKRRDADAGTTLRPCEYFHLITGVGGSGVIAILLGVLRLSVADTMDAFLQICEEISLGEYLNPDLRSEKLVSAAKVLLQRIGISEGATLSEDLPHGDGCKVAIPYMTAASLSNCRMLRSYDSVHSSLKTTIIEAIRIAWATPGLFSPVEAGPALMQQALISAANFTNNPTLQAIEEAHDVFTEDRQVCCVLSLGTGKPVMRSLEAGGLDLDQIVARETENITDQLKRRYNGLGIYFRLSMDRGIDFGTASDTIELRAGRIGASASSYLLTHDASEALENCLRSSRQASHITLENLYHTRSSGSRSSRGLPPLSPFFVPREKPMNSIVEALRRRIPGSPAIGLIVGLSGTGKTQISLKYAYDHDDEYGHIIFVDASSSESLEKTLVTRIKLIDDRLDITNVEGVKNLLANPKGQLTRNWLIIMDNVDNSEVKLQDYIPSCDHGCVLITSRNAALSDLHPEGYVEIGVMSREEAIEALLSAALGSRTNPRTEGPEQSRMGQVQSISRTKQDEECAGRIVDELGYLPLAVIQAACYIKKQKCLHQYSKLLKTSRNKILRWPASVQRDTLKYAHSTYAAFDTTLTVLSPRALKFLGILSFVNFSDFPKALIELAASLGFDYQPHDLLDRPPEYQLSIDLLREVFYPEGHWDPMELDSLLEELQSYSLVSLVAVSTIVTLRFHPLLHGWANDRLTTSDRSVFQTAAIRLLACGTNRDDNYLWPYLSSDIERFSLMADELHVNDKAALAETLSHRQSKKALDIWESIYATVSKVHGERHIRTTRAALQLADAYANEGDWQRMEIMERKVVEIRRETLGDVHMETATAMANLARTCKQNGQRFDEAIELELEVLRVRKEHCGPKHRVIVLAITDLAETYRRQEKYREAQNLLGEALDMISSLLGRAHPATIGVLQELSYCYALSGERDEEMKLDREIVELKRSVHGEMHVETLTAMAQLYYRQGQADAARKIWRNLAGEMRGAVGGHREHILRSLNALAHSTYQRSLYAESEVLWKELVATRRTTLGAEHANTLGAQNWLFNSVDQQEHYSEAEPVGRGAAAGLGRISGETHKNTLFALERLAICVYRQGRYAEAEMLLREVVAGRHATLGAEHGDTVNVQDWLFHSVYQQERYGDAEILGLDVITGLRRTLGGNHIKTLHTLGCLATCIHNQERFAEAEMLWREVVAGTQVTLGAKHADTVDAVTSLFSSIYQQERYSEAESLGRDAVIGLRQTLGDKHIETLSALFCTAICIHKQERYIEAEVLWREVAVGRRVTLGDEHEDTVSAQDWLFHSIYQQERYSDAEALGRDVITGLRRTLGENHIKTLYTLGCLATCIHKQERFAEAEVLWREVVAGRQHTLGAQHKDTLVSQMWLDRAIKQSAVATETTLPTTPTLEGEHTAKPSANQLDSRAEPRQSQDVATEHRRRRSKPFGSWKSMRGLFTLRLGSASRKQV